MERQFVLVVILLLIGPSFFGAGCSFTQAITVQRISSPVIIVTPTPTPIAITPSPTPSPTPVPSVSLDYEEVSQTTQGSETVVTLRVTATYNFGETATYNYQNFDLDIRTPRGGLEPFPIYLITETVKPLEAGSVTVGDNNRTADFTLTFRFSTIQNSFGGPIPFAYYELLYHSNAVSTSTPEPTPSPTQMPSPSPTVPELSWLIILPVLFSMFSVAIILRRRKTTKLD